MIPRTGSPDLETSDDSTALRPSSTCGMRPSGRPAITLAGLLAVVLLTLGCSNNTLKLADPSSLKNHPQSIAISINGVPVFWESVDRRGRAFLKDEQTFNHLAFAPDKEAEALDFYRRRAVKIEVMRHLLLNEARQMRIVVTDADRRNALARLQPLMARRNWTTNDFFTRSPLGAEQTHAEFEESLYIDKLLNDRVSRSVTVSEAEIEAASAELARTHPDATPKLPEVRQMALRGKTKRVVNAYYRNLVSNAVIECAFPDLTFDEVIVAP